MSVAVATNVCGDEPSLIFPTIDCPLCAVGWPMAGGFVGVEFYGPCCDKTTYLGGDCNWTSDGTAWTKISDPCFNGSGCGCPSPPILPSEGSTYATKCRIPTPSYWIRSGTGMLQFTLKCPNPGDDAEPSITSWIAEGTFAGNVPVGTEASNRYRIRIMVTPTDSNTLSLSGMVWWLDETKTWQGYTSFSATVDEIPTTYMPPFRQRNFRSDYIPISASIDGGQGDPISYVVLTVQLIPFREGCGTEDNSVPKCGFWDYTGWHSCFRAHVEGNSTATLDGSSPNIGRFVQLGLNGNPCGGVMSGSSPPSYQRHCGCDIINNGATALSHSAEENDDPNYISTYAVIGAPGSALYNAETAPYSRQQVQIGGELCVKNVNNGSIYIGYFNGTAWETAVASQVQATGPHIYKAVFTDTTVWLYSLRFPNSEILPEGCPATETGPDCGGSCYYIQDPLTAAWVLQPGNCGEWSGCSCVAPDAMYLVGGYMLTPCTS
jgi:hypothetical protein